MQKGILKKEAKNMPRGSQTNAQIDTQIIDFLFCWARLLFASHGFASWISTHLTTGRAEEATNIENKLFQKDGEQKWYGKDTKMMPKWHQKRAPHASNIL